ncbi:MAG: FHA domain-containing protein [Gemmatimonadota bacterium]
MTQSLALVHDAREIPLTGRAVLIGRLAECDVLLDGAEVSRRHARIVPTPKGPLLQDRSRYGTRVNGSQLVAPQLLHEGDVIQIGPWVLNVNCATGLGASESAAGWRIRLAQWRRRYGPSELTGTVAAVSVAVLVQRASGSLVLAAYAGTLAEMTWFYGVLALRDLRRVKRDAARVSRTVAGHTARGVLRNIVLEFGAAEALDALLFRPLAIGLGLRFIGGPIGALAGKLAADALFYGPVLRFFHWRLAPGAPSEPTPNLERARRTTTNTRPPSVPEPGGDGR